MFALILIPLALALAFSGLFDAEISRIAEENGLEDFDPNAPSLFDDIPLLPQNPNFFMGYDAEIV